MGVICVSWEGDGEAVLKVKFVEENNKLHNTIFLHNTKSEFFYINKNSNAIVCVCVVVAAYCNPSRRAQRVVSTFLALSQISVW